MTNLHHVIWNGEFSNWNNCVYQWNTCVAVLTCQTVMWYRLRCLLEGHKIRSSSVDVQRICNGVRKLRISIHDVRWLIFENPSINFINQYNLTNNYENGILASLCLSVRSFFCLSAWKYFSATVCGFMKFVEVIFIDLSRKSKSCSFELTFCLCTVDPFALYNVILPGAEYLNLCDVLENIVTCISKFV